MKTWQDQMKTQTEAYCAHTMLAKHSCDTETLVCCDCGRTFTSMQSVEEVREYEVTTGFWCPSRVDSP